MNLREMRPADWPGVAEVYRQGIETPDVTFHTAVPDYESWSRAHLVRPRLVLEEGGEILGFCALAPVSARACYRGVAELAIYLAKSARGKGLGKRLLKRMLAEAEGAGIWTIESHIFAENAASIALHKSAGFRLVGVRERIGVEANGKWHDTCLLEYRSKVVEYQQN